MADGTVRPNQNGGRVSPAGECQLAGGEAVGSIPCGEIHVVVLFHRERGVEACQHGRGVVEIGSRERTGPQYVDHTDREQGGSHPVPADIKQVEGEGVVVEPMVSEGIAPELRGGHEDPVRGDRLSQLAGKHRARVSGGLREFGCHRLVGLLHLLNGLGQVGRPLPDRPLKVGIPLGEACLPESDFPGHGGKTPRETPQLVRPPLDAFECLFPLFVGAFFKIGRNRLKLADRPGNPPGDKKDNPDQEGHPEAPDDCGLNGQFARGSHDELVRNFKHQLPSGVPALGPINHLVTAIFQAQPAAGTGKDFTDAR